MASSTRRLVIVGPLPPPSGGIATHVSTLVAAMERRGVRCSVLDPGRERFPWALAHVVRAASLRRSVLVHVHACGHNWQSYALLAACLLACSSPWAIPPIVSLHSGLAPAYLAGIPRSARRLLGLVLNATSGVVAVSADVSAAVRALGVPEEKIVVAPAFLACGLRTDPKAPGKLPAEVARARARSARLLVAPVAVGHEYGTDLLVSAFARLAKSDPGATLVVFGPGGADRALASALSRRGLGTRVVAAGELSHEKALAVMATGDLLVRPTRADGDAVSVREALALGTRVVASDAAPRPCDVLTFPSGHAAAFAEAMATALALPRPRPVPCDESAPLWDLYRRLGLGWEEERCVALPDE